MSVDPESQRIDISNQYLWCKRTYDFLVKHLNPSIVEIDLSTCHVNEDSARLLATALQSSSTQIRTLVLANCRLTTVASTTIIKALSRSVVENLVLDGNILTPEVCFEFREVFATNRRLSYCSLKNCNILRDGCKHVAEGLSMSINLKYLFLDGNCIFSEGLEFLTQELKNSRLQGLSVSDNQIWMEGMRDLFNVIKTHPTLTSLDVSYNAIEIMSLTQCLNSNTNLKHLNISGCKANQADFAVFLEEIPAHIETFIVEGINYKTTPVSWPHETTPIWSNRKCFTSLMQGIRKATSLSDLRCGFFELEQINAICAAFEQQHITRPMMVTMSDFGKSGTTWVAEFPDHLHAPLPVFEWKAKMTSHGADVFGKLLAKSVCDGAPVDSVILSKTGINDEMLAKIVEGCPSMHMRTLDLSDNDIGNGSIEKLIELFGKVRVDSLSLKNTRITETGLSKLFQYFAAEIESVPQCLEFSCTRSGQLFNDLATLIRENCGLVELIITGVVKETDCTKIVAALENNSTLRAIKITAKGDGIPESDPEEIAELVGALHHSMTYNGSSCCLCEFQYPQIQTVFEIGNPVLSKWGEIEERLEANQSP